MVWYGFLFVLFKQWGMVSDTTDTTTYTINYNISFPKKSTMIIFPNSGKKQPVYYTGQWTSPGTNSFDVIYFSITFPYI